MGFANRKGPSFKDFKRQMGMYGRDREDEMRAAHEKDIKKRYELKMNWGIANRWEQRELDAVIKNKDVRSAQFRDITKIKTA